MKIAFLSLVLLSSLANAESNGCEGRFYLIQDMHNEGVELHNSAADLAKKAFRSKSNKNKCHLLKQSQSMLTRASGKFEACRQNVSIELLHCNGTSTADLISDRGNDCRKSVEHVQGWEPKLLKEITTSCS